MTVRLRVLSLGAGVQSTTLALMAAAGEITPMPDCAIFADTGEEPAAVYSHLSQLTERLPFPVHVVRAWEGYGKPSIKSRLGDEILSATRGEGKAGSHSRPPFFVSNADGSKGIIRRQCTGDYKIDVIQAKERELLGLKRGQRWPSAVSIVQWIGISTDEAARMKPVMQRRKVNGEMRPVPHPAIEGRWPLIDARMSRWDCMRWLEGHGFEVPPKSACTFCPFHADAEWRRINADPVAWARAVEIDRAIRHGLVAKSLEGSLYLHASLKPLEDADLSTAEERGQGNLFTNECEGMCGV